MLAARNDSGEMPEMGWIVHKFGGTSLADADCFRRVAAIITRNSTATTAVVVSAMRGITDQLFSVIEIAAAGQDIDAALDAIRNRQTETATELLAPDAARSIVAQLDVDLKDIRNVLQALSLVRSASHRSRDVITGYGEIWSARLLEQQRSSWLIAFVDGLDQIRRWRLT
jgi:aspartokinase/homoserine dehydrogenase 1